MNPLCAHYSASAIISSSPISFALFSHPLLPRSFVSQSQTCCHFICKYFSLYKRFFKKKKHIATSKKHWQWQLYKRYSLNIQISTCLIISFFFLVGICANQDPNQFAHWLVNMPFKLVYRFPLHRFFFLLYNLLIEETGLFVLQKCPTVWILLKGQCPHL